MSRGGLHGRTVLLAASLATALSLLPIGLHWAWIGRARQVSAVEASAILEDPAAQAVLVDVRPLGAFQAGHLQGAVHWPVVEIASASSPDDVPASLHGKVLLLICDGGVASARAALALERIGVQTAYSIQGGMQAWIASAARPGSAVPAVRTIESSAGETAPLPSPASPSHEQTAAVLAGFVIKPAYMLLFLALIVMLRRNDATDLKTLRWGLIFFLAGEVFCSVNYIFFQDGSLLFEYLHSLGMVAGLGFIAWAGMEGLDRRVVGYSSATERCAVTALCAGCAKRRGGPCPLRQLFLYLSLALAAVALIPLTMQPQPVSYNTVIWGTPYNYSHATLHQWYELRFCPWAALVLFLGSFVALWRGGDAGVAPSKILLAGGTGLLGFGLLRTVLLQVYEERMVWYVFWEEATELIFAAGLVYVLWLFRKTLLHLPQPASA